MDKARIASRASLTQEARLRMGLVDAERRPLRTVVREALIGHGPPLDLSREVYDTRLAPKASFTTTEPWRVDRPGLGLRPRVAVEPDHFYARFFDVSRRQTERRTAPP